MRKGSDNFPIEEIFANFRIVSSSSLLGVYRPSLRRVYSITKSAISSRGMDDESMQR